MYTHVYTCIHNNVYVCIYIYIYIYTWVYSDIAIRVFCCFSSVGGAGTWVPLKERMKCTSWYSSGGCPRMMPMKIWDAAINYRVRKRCPPKKPKGESTVILKLMDFEGNLTFKVYNL